MQQETLAKEREVEEDIDEEREETDEEREEEIDEEGEERIPRWISISKTKENARLHTEQKDRLFAKPLAHVNKHLSA